MSVPECALGVQGRWERVALDRRLTEDVRVRVGGACCDNHGRETVRETLWTWSREAIPSWSPVPSFPPLVAEPYVHKPVRQVTGVACFTVFLTPPCYTFYYPLVGFNYCIMVFHFHLGFETLKLLWQKDNVML